MWSVNKRVGEIEETEWESGYRKQIEYELISHVEGRSVSVG